MDPTEPADTLELLCMALLGVIVAVNDVLGGVGVGEPLDLLASDFAALSAANKADRDHSEDLPPSEGR